MLPCSGILCIADLSADTQTLLSLNGWKRERKKITPVNLHPSGSIKPSHLRHRKSHVASLTTDAATSGTNVKKNAEVVFDSDTRALHNGVSSNHLEVTSRSKGPKIAAGHHGQTWRNTETPSRSDDRPLLGVARLPALTLWCYAVPAGRMKIVLVIMTGIGFTLGVVFGLLLQLPIDTLPAESVGNRPDRPLSGAAGRSRRSLLHGEGPGVHQPIIELERLPDQVETHGGGSAQDQSHESNSRSETEASRLNTPGRGVWSSGTSRSANSSQDSGQAMGASRVQLRKNTGQSRNSARRPESPALIKPRLNDATSSSSSSSSSQPASSSTDPGAGGVHVHAAAGNQIPPSNIEKDLRGDGLPSREDLTYLATLVHGVTWSPQLEASCPRPFPPSEVDAWRRRASSMDIVKVEEGCGRMQNRLVTFRDSSRACARYRLNTDQIQGEVFSYYLARLLNVSHIPPTLLARVDSLSSRWRSVHLQLSLAQWADSKLVVLTKYIDGMTPSHIPPEFRGEGEQGADGRGTFSFKLDPKTTGGERGSKGTRTSEALPPHFRPRLAPTVSSLGGKSRPELCQLLQWSDLIVFDYLTANLDRVINNMFNRQWNDQMMASPAHNLEQRSDGALVFLDNESGLFHGYRLLDKYAAFHRSLLGALCVFRPSTVAVVKRLRISRSVGKELHELFAREEPELHGQLAPLPEKNTKVLQQRLEDVYAQIVACEKVYGSTDSDSSYSSTKAFSPR
ncbi:four-jointed box protein [Plakobranchus ocellatus]|uniref:Four-jointed box protein n=1 Tax=Plakobranchus ocellatus TaxID=259542 RepID=A0AAV4DTQ4_9GAST|nr:four-jointed box protein [Plakobranchus ocellatus]